MRKRSYLVAGILVLFVLAGLVFLLVRNDGGGDKGKGATADVASITLVAAQDPVSLDPAKLADTESSPVVSAIFAPLTLVRADGELEYILAERIDVASDGLSATITLRDNARFSDGTPVTAGDVRFTFERLQRLSHPQRYIFERITGMQSVDGNAEAHAEGLEVVDAKTLRVLFDEPEPDFARLVATAFAGIVKEGSDLLPSQPLDRQLIGAGPLQISTIEPGVRYTFKANPGFPLQDRPERVELLIRGNDQEIARLAAAGRIDLLRVRGGLLPEVLVEKDGNVVPRSDRTELRVERYPAEDLLYIRLNWQDGALASVPALKRRAVMSAMSQAIDRQAIVDRVYLGTATPAFSAVPVANVPETTTADVELPERIELLTATVGELRAVVDLVAADLRGKGIEVEVRTLSIGDFIGRLFGGKYETALLWLESNLRPAEFSWAMFYSEGSPIAALAQPVEGVEKEVAAARSMLSLDQRLAHMQGTLKMIARRQDAVLPLVRREAVYLVKSSVVDPGIDANGILQISLVKVRR